MKKLCSMLLALCMICCILTAVAETAEDAPPVVIEPGMIMISADGLTLSLADAAELIPAFDGTLTLQLGVLLTNHSGDDVGLCIDSVTVNGVSLFTIFAHGIAPGSSEYAAITLYDVDQRVGVQALDDLEVITLHCHTYSTNTYFNLTNDITVTFALP